MHLFISAGEPSGDLHGANLIRALRAIYPDAKIVGFGGDKMEAAGCKLLYPLCRLSVMWFLSVFTNILTFIRILKQGQKYFRDEKPDALIMIDFPGFHWKLAERAKAEGIPVYYFVPPQIWAWAQWRVKKMARLTDTVLTALPFEDAWLKERGVRTNFIGHPYFDELQSQKLDPTFLEEQRAKPGRIIGILPGSRTKEVTRNLEEMLLAAKKIHAQKPDTRFLVASFNEHQAEIAAKMIPALGIPVEMYVGRTPEIIELAEACIAVSGSVGLEMMYRETPAVIIYRLTPFSLKVGKFFMKCRFISLVNLLAEEEVYPEFLTDRDPSTQVAEKVLIWLESPDKVRETQAKLQNLHHRFGEPGACDRAAKFITQQVLLRKPPVTEASVSGS